MYSENMTDCSNMTPDEVNERLKELEHQATRLRNHNAELQHFMQITDKESAAFEKERLDLGNQIKGLKQTIKVAEQLGADLEESRNLATERQHIITSSRNHIRALEKENKALLEQNGTLYIEMAFITSERKKGQEKIASQSSSLRDVQNLLEESKDCLINNGCAIQEKNCQIAELENSLAEYSIALQNMRQSKIELEKQLEKALLFPNQDMFGDNLCAPSSPQPMSLADELDLFSRVGMVDCSGEDIDENSALRLGVDQGAANVENEQENVQAKSWWQQYSRSLVNGVRAAGAFTLGFLIPLGLLASSVPACYDQTTGFSCGNILLTTSRYLVEPYCDIYSTGMHPF